MTSSQKACLRKAKYSRAEAKGALKVRHAEKPWQVLDIYLCPHCHFWHTTSRKMSKVIS